MILNHEMFSPHSDLLLISCWNTYVAVSALCSYSTSISSDSDSTSDYENDIITATSGSTVTTTSEIVSNQLHT